MGGGGNRGRLAAGALPGDPCAPGRLSEDDCLRKRGRLCFLLPAPRSQLPAPSHADLGEAAWPSRGGGSRLTFRTDPSSPPFPEKLYLALSVGLDIWCGHSPLWYLTPPHFFLFPSVSPLLLPPQYSCSLSSPPAPLQPFGPASEFAPNTHPHPIASPCHWVCPLSQAGSVGRDPEGLAG